MHRDFHSGNILFNREKNNQWKFGVLLGQKNDQWNFGDPLGQKNDQWNIGDLGLSQAVNSKSSNDEIYGVIPYIAPEIFKGSKFTKEADIYSLGMIMWELTTGCKPFDNVNHDIQLVYKILDGERPKITEDTPECYANLMKSCWDSNPKKRPSIKDICLTFKDWAKGNNHEIFNQAEAKRKVLIQSKKIGPEYAEKRHSEAIYTSRSLSALISKCSSIYSTSTNLFGNLLQS
jgi:serine/threonine protein kinase